MKRPTCPTCSRDLPAEEITTMSSDESEWVTTGDCEHCPQPACPLCDRRLEFGKCWNLDCTLAGQLAPNSETP